MSTSVQGRKRGRPTKLEVEERKKAAEKEAKLRFNVTVPATPVAAAFDLYDAQNIVFKPNKGPQTEFLSASERQVLYGGAGGGGKSYAMLADPLRDMNNPNFSGLLVRHTTEELRELITKSQDLYPKAIPGIVWSERKQQWTTPRGATLWMSFLDRDIDVERYRGLAFNWIGFDELTQWATPYAFSYMGSRLRTADPDLKLYMRACVDEGEVLTPNGWVDITKVTKGDIVFSLDSSGNLVEKKVTGYYEYDVDEELVRIRKKTLYMSMTPDHRVVYKKYGSSANTMIRYNEHSGKSVNIVRTSSSYTAQGYTPTVLNFSADTYAEFIGLYVAEGCINTTPVNGNYKVVITQNKEFNHTFVRRVMEASGCNVCYCKNGDFQINSKELREHLMPLGKAHQKHFPREFLAKASKEQLQLAFDAYILGDGHRQSENNCSAHTSSPKLVDDLQEIAVKLGYKTQVKMYPSTNPNHNDKYVVYFTWSADTTKVDKNTNGRKDVAYEKYKGKVYCIGVQDTENFIIRQKGFVWVSGNTTNPGGAGMAWVKKGFVSPAPYNTPFPAVDFETGEVLRYPAGHTKAGKTLYKRRFIPATLFDNPYLAKDGQYEAMLLSLPEAQRKQMLYGDWDISEGAAFTEFNRKIHVIEPFDIPRDWVRFRAADYGYGSKTAVLWFAIAPDEQLIVYRELYTSKVTAVDLADMINAIERNETMRYGVLDSSLWHKRGDTGPSLAEQMIMKGCRWRPSDRSKGSRVAGKNEIHRRLQVNPNTGEPRLVFFNTCVNIIAELPALPLSRNNPEDVDTNANDHGYDALRYGCMSRPRSGLWDYDPTTSSSGFQASCQTFGY